jgi:hypothetical protein
LRAPLDVADLGKARLERVNGAIEVMSLLPAGVAQIGALEALGERPDVVAAQVLALAAGGVYLVPHDDLHEVGGAAERGLGLEVGRRARGQGAAPRLHPAELPRRGRGELLELFAGVGASRGRQEGQREQCGENQHY